METAARRWGVQQGTPIVAYDDWNRAGSARAWWVLTAAGLANARILDGGLAAWRAAGNDLESGPATSPLGNVVVPHADLYNGSRPTLTAQVSGAGDVTLLDARAPERYVGDVEPLDPIAGHIPGAKNVPSTAVLTPDGVLLNTGAVTQLVCDRGIDPSGRVGAYCGSGVSATVVVAALSTDTHPARSSSVLPCPRSARTHGRSTTPLWLSPNRPTVMADTTDAKVCFRSPN